MAALSKSRYTLSCQCQKALWLNTYKPEEAVVDPSVEERFAEGQVVGDLAKSLFSDYVDTTTYTDGGELDIAAMIDKTKELVNSGCPVICEAAFAPEHHYCAVDILRKEDAGWAIYEVKSKSSKVDDDYTNPEFGKYAIDIAYQRWVLEQCGICVTGTYLVTINSDYVRRGELVLKTTDSGNGLFNIIDLGPIVENEYQKVPNQSLQALQTLEQTTELEMPLSIHCHKPYHCAFWKHCTSHLPKPSVFDVHNIKFTTKLEHYHAGRISFNDLAGKNIGKIQDMQINCTINQVDHINFAGIQKFLDKVSYPLYFLDFESMQSAVPIYDNTNPYMQICFQYSLHYVECAGGELQHKAFLAQNDGSDPRRPLAEALCRDIPRGACIMVYNKSFEQTCIKKMAAIYPDLKAHLMDIHAHIIDLQEPFKGGHYLRPAMCGTFSTANGMFSIKSVLPALFPDDPNLDYHNLSTMVQNGGDAKSIFPKIQNMSLEEAAKARQALLDYCHLDTLAMFKIWERLKELVK